MSQPGSYDPWDDVIDALDDETCPHEAHERCRTDAAIRALEGSAELRSLQQQAAKKRYDDARPSRAAYMRDYRARRKKIADAKRAA